MLHISALSHTRRIDDAAFIRALTGSRRTETEKPSFRILATGLPLSPITAENAAFSHHFGGSDTPAAGDLYQSSSNRIRFPSCVSQQITHTTKMFTLFFVLSMQHTFQQGVRNGFVTPKSYPVIPSPKNPYLSGDTGFFMIILLLYSILLPIW